MASIKEEDELSEIPPGIVEVTELSSTEVLEGIEAIALNIANQVMACKGFSMDIPSRASSVSFSTFRVTIGSELWQFLLIN